MTSDDDLTCADCGGLLPGHEDCKTGVPCDCRSEGDEAHFKDEPMEDER